MNARTTTRDRSTVQAELSSARQQYSAAAAAYAANRGDADAQRTVADARYRVDLLESELAGVEAHRAAESHARNVTELQQAIADTTAQQEAASAAAATAVAEFETAAGALAEFAAAYHRAQSAVADAQRQVTTLTHSGAGLATFGVSLVSTSAGPQLLDNLVGGLLHAHDLQHLRAERNDAITDRAGKPDAKAAAAILARHFATSATRVADVTRRTRAELESRLAAVQTPAAA